MVGLCCQKQPWQWIDQSGSIAHSNSAPTTIMAAAASRIELALCFEDVAKNIFGNADGTMTRCAPHKSPPHDYSKPNRSSPGPFLPP